MKRRKFILKSGVIVVFMIICFIGAIYSCYKIFIWKQNVDRNNEIKKQVDELIEFHEDEKLKDKYTVDFQALKEINSDVVAWIKVNGTNIEYPVVKGVDNSYYLKHNLKKEWNNAGWIFADYKNHFDGTDRNIVIFGHNTRDGSMFGSLKNVLEKDWHENVENTIIMLVDGKESIVYQVFSTYSITPEDYYINTEFNNDRDFTEFLKTIQSRSNYNYDINVDSSDSILTLSSCIGDGKKRVVLHAKKIY